MPRVKINYVVSFSSEDPEHPANNLLAWEVSKKKWLCKKGESSCSVVLQLTKAVKISSVHIGAYHSALVEVLVARSEKATDQYQALVPSCVFVPPTESRRDVPVERVRSFSVEQLAADARHQRWDRVRVVCSQPYNKHCKYGLSFIHIDEASPEPARLALDTLSSDDEEFRPGELFASHLRDNHSPGPANDTGAQIRQATSQALKNITDSSTKLIKTPISKPSGKRPDVIAPEGRPDRSRDTLLYSDDDDKPHAKIDQVVQRHKDHKQKEDKTKTEERKDKDVKKDKVKDKTKTTKRRQSDSPPASETPPSKKTHKNNGESTCSAHKNNPDDRKKRHVSCDETEQAGEASAPPHTLLSDVVLVLSGYENPQRAHVRNTALAMGARVERDWGPACTHLICAFPNTPKLRQVRATSGPGVPVVLAEWLLQCSAQRRRLPWQSFATEPARRRALPAALPPTLPPAPPPTLPPALPPAPPPHSVDDEHTECDTDDEIEKVLQKQKAKRFTTSTDAEPRARSRSSDRTAVVGADEGPPTDDEARDVAVPRWGGALPHFFDGRTFVIDADEPDAAQLTRYVKAYGGLVLQLSELEEDSEVEYVISARARPPQCGGARVLPPSWLARCHSAGRLVPPD